MPCCCAIGCSSRSEKGKTLYSLPTGKRNEERRNQWLRNIGRRNFKPTTSTKVCEDHFTPDQFEPQILAKFGIKKLKVFAVPTIFPDDPSASVKRRKLKRKAAEEENENKKPVKKRRVGRQSDCCVPQCDSFVGKGICFFPFPAKKSLREAWEEPFKEKNWKLKKKSQICEKHFTSDQFLDSKRKKRKALKKNAKPTVFIVPCNPVTYTVKKTVPVIPIIKREDNDQVETEIVRVPDHTYCGDNEGTKEGEVTYSGQKGLSIKVACTNEDKNNEVIFYSNVDKSIEIKMLNDEIKKLEAEVDALEKELEEEKEKTMKAEGKLRPIFSKDQMEVLFKNSGRGTRWSDETIIYAINIFYSLGFKVYKSLIRSSFPLPGIRTLKRWMLKVDPNFTITTRKRRKPEDVNQTDFYAEMVESKNIVTYNMKCGLLNRTDGTTESDREEFCYDEDDDDNDDSEHNLIIDCDPDPATMESSSSNKQISFKEINLVHCEEPSLLEEAEEPSFHELKPVQSAVPSFHELRPVQL